MTRPATRLLLLALFVRCASPGAPSPSSGARVCVVRHAESHRNLQTPPPELTDAELDGLTERGLAQAQRARAALALDDRAIIFASPVERAVRTAEIIAGGRPFETEEALRFLEEGRTAEEALLTLRPLITRILARRPAPRPLVLVTHSDISALLLGEPEGTPIAERAAQHTLETGELRCVNWD